MAAPRLLPDGGTLLNLRVKGWTLDQIAEEYGVTKAAVYLQLRNIPGGTTERPNHKELIPWKVAQAHTHDYPAMMLRLLSREIKGELPAIPLAKQKMLDSWKKQLKELDLVVCYDADFPPNPASPKHGGWFYAKRSDGDNEWIRPLSDKQPARA